MTAEEEKSARVSSSIAKCNICSTFNRNISVICEARCLICARCQQTPTIRKLFVSSPAECPLCDQPMSRTMARLVHSFGSLESLNGVSNSFDLDTTQSPYGSFLKRYRATYPAYQESGQGYGFQLSEYELKEVDAAAVSAISGVNATALGNVGGGIGGSDLPSFLTALGDGGHGDSRPLSPQGTRPSSPHGTRPSSPQDLGAGSNKGKKNGKQPEAEQTIYAILPHKFNNVMLNEFALECYGLLWGVIARQGNEGMCGMTLRFCSKKRLSQRSNDFKMKGFLDYYFESTSTKEGAALLESSPHAVLFGKIVGLLPRRQTSVRKVWGAVGLGVLAFAYVEKCWKSGELVDSESNPLPADVKAKLNKLQSNKQLPVKRVIQIIGKLNDSNQAHWTMAPVKSACQEYNARQPWVRDSTSRLMHLLIYAALWVNGRIKEVSAGGGESFTVVLAASGSTEPMSNSDIKQQCLPRALQQHQKQVSVETPAQPAVHTSHKSGSPPAPRHRDHRKDTDNDKDKEEAKEDVSSVVGIKLLRALSAKANLLWGARTHILSRPATLADVMCFSEQGTVAELIPEVAIELCSRLSMGVCEAALVLIDAWEAEYTALQLDMRKALMSTTRRPAITGTYDSRHAELNKVERLAIIRLLKYHNEQNELGVDWTSIKAAYSQGPFNYPFTIPDSLLEKSVAELNYHAVGVIAQYEKAKAKEFIEDLVTASGPYAKTPLQVSRPPRSPISRRDGGRPVAGSSSASEASADREMNGALDPEQIKAVHRAEYLAAQSLGGGGGAASIPLRSRPSSAYVPLPLPIGDEEDQSFITQVHTRASDILDDLSESLAGLSDPRPTLQAYTIAMTDAPKQRQRRPESHEEHQARENILDSRELLASTGGQSRPVSSAEVLAMVPPGQSRARPPLHHPLSTVPYSSPLPARHPVFIVDVLDNDVSVLTKARLLSALPVGPNTSKSRLRTLDEQLFGALEEALAFDDGAEEESSEHSSPTNKGAVGKTTTTTATTTTMSTSTGASSDKQALLEQMTAKQRVWTRAEDQRKALQAREEKLRAERMQERAKRAAEEPLMLIPRDAAAGFTRVDIKSAIGLERKFKAPVGPAQSVESKLASEQTVQMLLLTDMTAAAPIEAATWIAISDAYLKPFQMQALLKLDFSQACMGPLGGTVLAKAFRIHCSLIDLRLGGNNIGDSACGKLLSGAVTGGAGSSLLILDLSSNNLTMISEGLGSLSHLKSIKQLDLSRNKLTLDLAKQHETLRRALGNLPALEAISLAYNRIQDAGFATFIDLILRSEPGGLPSLGYIDLQSCFITPRSFAPLMELIKHPSTATRKWVANCGLQFQLNIFTNEQMSDLGYCAGIRDIPIKFSGASVGMFDSLPAPYSSLIPGSSPQIINQDCESQQGHGKMVVLREQASSSEEVKRIEDDDD